MEDPLKHNIISQPIIIGAPTSSWDNERIEEIMNGKMNQRWNREMKPFYQERRNDKNIYRNEYFRNSAEEQDMGPRYEKRDQGGGKNYNGRQEERYNQNPGGYNGQNNRRFNDYGGRNNGERRNGEFNTIKRNFRDRNQGRRFDFERGPGSNNQRRDTYNERGRSNNREYMNGKYMRMNNGDKPRRNKGRYNEEMRMRNTNNETLQRCFNCGKPGHIQIECRLPRAGSGYKNDYQQTRTQQECFNCGKVGHISRECRLNRPRGPKCAACYEFGHIFQDCRTHEIVRAKNPKGNQVFVNEKFKCEGCRAFGHTIHDCIEYLAIKKNLNDQEGNF